MQFNLRTVADGGLLLFGGGEGSGSGYIAAELRDGYLYFMVDNGAGPRMVRIATPRRLNDGAWHSVAIRQVNRIIVMRESHCIIFSRVFCKLHLVI